MRKSKDIRSRKKLHLDKIHTIVAIAQFAITAVLVLVILQMITMYSYNNGMIITCTTISYVLAIILMSILAKQLFSWYKSNRNLVIILYAISSTIIAVNAGLTLIFVDIILMHQPTEVRPHSGFVSPTVTLFLTSVSLSSILNYAYIITTVASFVSFWVSTAFLLRHYSERLGSTKYWFMLSTPLIFFLSQFMPFFVDLFSAFRQSEPILFSLIYTVIFTLSKPAGGILFGIAFWLVARSLPNNSVVRDYLIISGFGIILLLVSNQAMILVSFTYPPFGLVTISFLGISSYLILVGIYSSALSVSEDINLRKSIKSHVLKELKLLDSIGIAQMEKEIERKAISFIRTRDSMVEETGVSPSLTDDDIKKYLEQVLKEAKK